MQITKIFAILSSQDEKMDFFLHSGCAFLSLCAGACSSLLPPVDGSITAFTVPYCPLPNWSSAAVSPRSVRTARSQTSRRWTARSLPWSPVCSIASQCDRCFHSAWNRSVTGLWPCYRLQGGKRNHVTRQWWYTQHCKAKHQPSLCLFDQHQRGER